MAGRTSFQKRQKEAARKEKRQMKIERRQGRATYPACPGSEQDETNGELTDRFGEDGQEPGLDAEPGSEQTEAQGDSL